MEALQLGRALDRRTDRSDNRTRRAEALRIQAQAACGGGRGARRFRAICSGTRSASGHTVKDLRAGSRTRFRPDGRPRNLLTGARKLGIVAATVMFRHIATWVLLLPLSLNGLWMVCETAPGSQTASSAAATETAQKPAEKANDTQAMAHCKTMCPTTAKPNQTGSIC